MFLNFMNKKVVPTELCSLGSSFLNHKYSPSELRFWEMPFFNQRFAPTELCSLDSSFFNHKGALTGLNQSRWDEHFNNHKYDPMELFQSCRDEPLVKKVCKVIYKSQRDVLMVKHKQPKIKSHRDELIKAERNYLC